MLYGVDGVDGPGQGKWSLGGVATLTRTILTLEDGWRARDDDLQRAASCSEITEGLAGCAFMSGVVSQSLLPLR